MMQIKKYSRCIAMVLILSFMFAMITPIQVYAQDETDASSVIDAINSMEDDAEYISYILSEMIREQSDIIE